MNSFGANGNIFRHRSQHSGWAVAYCLTEDCQTTKG
jgi:hypothetical protein